MPHNYQQLMSSKIALLLFTTSVLLVSFAVMSNPQASALTPSTRNDNVFTSSYGNYIVCGDHKCAPGEHNKWVDAIWQFQKDSYGKIPSGMIGEDIMKNLANSTSTMSSGNATVTGTK
jgi:hypothetical protein